MLYEVITDRTRLGGQRLGDHPRHFGRSGKGHAGTMPVGDQRGTDPPAPGQERQRAGRHTCRMQEAHRQRGDQRGLLSRFCNDGIAA